MLRSGHTTFCGDRSRVERGKAWNSARSRSAWLSKDIEASKRFYEKFGFSVFMGDASQNWLILKNCEHVIVKWGAADFVGWPSVKEIVYHLNVYSGKEQGHAQTAG